jgi:RNA polymerase sigma-70 factor (ECF subfamily)
MQGLLALFSKEIVCYTDGGGRANALLNPIYGHDNVARLLIGSHKKFRPAQALFRIVEINGEPGLVSYLDGKARTVITLDCSGDQIKNVYIMRNPEKLEHVPSIPS